MSNTYKKSTPRITVQYYDEDTDELLFEIKDRTWINVGDLFSDHYANEIVKNELGDDAPDNLMILAVGKYSK